MRGVAAVAILMLALGISATTTMFSVVYAALLRPLPFSEPDRLVIVYNMRVTARDGTQRLRWSWPHIVELQRTVTTIESVASLTGPSIGISGDGDAEQIDGEVVSSRYFEALRVAPTAGRTFSHEEDTLAGAQAVAIVSDRLWRRRYNADPALVGNTIRVNDVPLTVVGIMPRGFAGLSGKADLWMPPPMAARLSYNDYLTTPQHFISVVGRLKPGVSLEQANAELGAIGSQFADADSPATTGWSAAAIPVGRARVDPAVRTSALVLLAAAACVLIIACVNVASLLLARARTRRREIAIRLAVGSSRASIVRQLLAESLLLAGVAGTCGIAVAVWGAALFTRAAPAVIASGRNDYGAIATFSNPALDPRVLLFALAATVGTVLFFGLVPALAASKADVVTALKDDERVGGRSRGLAGLVVSEVALAVLLLTGSGLLLESFWRMQGLRAGFTSDGVLTFWVRPSGSRYRPADGPAFLERLLTRVEAVPGVDAAAVSRCTPFTGCARSVVFFPDRPVDRSNAPGIGRHYVSADYFRTLGIPLIAGRALTIADRSGARPVAVVNETGARRFWPGENPIGKRAWFGTTTGPFSDPAHAVEIVGVAGDVKYEGVDQSETPDRADFYTSYLQFANPDTMVIVKTHAATSVLSELRSAVAAVDPALPVYDVMTLEERVASAVARPRFDAALLTAFAGAALLLAAIGVYGVLSYSVSSRMREIGVRLALGADANRVVGLVLGEGLRLAAVGASIGLVAALAIARLLRGMLAAVAAPDPLMFLAASALMLVVAGAAALVPARRASAVDPIVVLRME